ncbi:phage portal protein [Noviherbaspirillum galbum]|uniref:Phage portal protein n=1 Tax=Noviherbaspirillum galbum TaxID=2709383 RepID=A0A6B3SQY1_9BURK|nr:phage portal protein [Noviherbaspirillum galbum]NEX61725.1 phage portal protein [Noviherbaspirillum galbum]
MNIIQRIFNRIERRSEDLSWRGAAILRGGGGAPGQAESLSTVYACVSAISETIASLPLILYRKTDDDGRDRADDHPLYKVLHDSPNDLQSALEFRELMQASVLLRGNAYAEILRGYDGQVRTLLPIPADRVTVLQLDNGRLAYDVSDLKGNKRRLIQEEVFHLRHRSDNGKVGVSPITASRETVQLALAERDHGNSTFLNGTRLSGLLKFPGKLNAEQKTTIGQHWQSQYGSGANAGKTAVLDQGLDYQTVSMSMEDAQWLEARQFSVEEIARLFRVPPTIIGDLRHGNYSNSVEMGRIFVVHTLRRHLAMWEQAISRMLLTEAGRRIYFAEHNVEGLLRGDSNNRADFYAKGIADGWLTVDEVRKFENLPKLKADDKPKAPQAPDPQAPAPGTQPDDGKGDPGAQDPKQDPKQVPKQDPKAATA